MKTKKELLHECAKKGLPYCNNSMTKAQLLIRLNGKPISPKEKK